MRSPEPISIEGFGPHVIRTRETVVVNENMAEAARKFGSSVIPGERGLEKSTVFVPLVMGDLVRGVINLRNTEREHAFSDSDVRLLQTLANAMSVPLQNAQSFKAEQERVAELALINSVQEGLASKLDMQAIYDLVGDKIREIFRTDGVAISRIDQEAGLVHVPYFYKQDQRFHFDSEPLTAEERREIHMPRTELWDTDAKVKIAYERGDIPAPGTTMPRSVVDVPLVGER